MLESILHLSNAIIISSQSFQIWDMLLRLELVASSFSSHDAYIIIYTHCKPKLTINIALYTIGSAMNGMKLFWQYMIIQVQFKK